jgi:hypothetical protein
VTIALRLFAFSFVALFPEVMMIRWVPPMVSMTQSHGNLLLISSFLGPGIGSPFERARIVPPPLVPSPMGHSVSGRHWSWRGAS